MVVQKGMSKFFVNKLNCFGAALSGNKNTKTLKPYTVSFAFCSETDCKSWTCACFIPSEF